MDRTLNFLQTRLRVADYRKISEIKNAKLCKFLADAIKLCDPSDVFVCDDSPKDLLCIRNNAITNGEETKLAISGHTIHFDAYGDQGRDKKNTLVLVSNKTKLDSCVETGERTNCLKEVKKILKDIMVGRKMFVRFFSLGPLNSKFTITCVQITDSPYVAHSEHLLYRPGYNEFVRQGPKAEFFKFIHSQGEVDERKVSKNLDKRRIYVDLAGRTVYSVNTQYGGNSIGLKKLALRLTIKKAIKEGWLCEHMAVFGIKGPGGRITYFTGAFPSLCGKTSTSMQQGGLIIGDDLAYLREEGGETRAVNAERGMFGIIQGVNSNDDPTIWKALHNIGEIIFSNVLVTEDSDVHWIGKYGNEPCVWSSQKKAWNHSGEWQPGKKDAADKEITISHLNARFTLPLSLLENLDSEYENPDGVPIKAIVYGGRDSDTNVPVTEAFGWQHGIIAMGASLESETTAATLGKEGVREFNPMSNLDFLSIPIADYINSNLKFGRKLKNPPSIFLVNYFLKDKEGNFLNTREDKRVWYKWMELRVSGDVDIIRTPVGLIPQYKDLKRLFKEVLNKEYSLKEYEEQFQIRITEQLAKIERVKNIYGNQILNTPKTVFRVLEAQRKRLTMAQKKYRKQYIFPDELIG